jgi:hypothetical protein
VAAGVVVIALGTWTTRPSSDQPDSSPPTVTPAKNPVDLSWYAGGKVHLDEVTVELPALTDLAGVAGGAVYGDASGAVGFVAADGSATVLGAKRATAPLVVSSENGWAAWVDGGGDGTELVLYDLAADEPLGWLDVARGSRPIAIDQDRVFYATPDGDLSWAPGVQPEPLERNGLLDVDSATRVYGNGGRIEMVQSFFSVSFVRPGNGAMLSPGGAYALTRPPRSPYDEPFRPVLYDTRSGERVPSGLDPDERAIDAAFGPNHTVSYLVTREAELGGGPDLDGNSQPLVVLRSCDVASVACHDLIPLVRSGDRPLLAH